MKRMWLRLSIVWLAMALMLPVGCMNNDNATRNEDEGTASNNETKGTRPQGVGQLDKQGPADNSRQRGYGMGTGMRAQSMTEGRGEDAVIAMLEKNGQQYVPLRELANVLEFKSEWDASTSTFRIGDNDVAYEVKANSTHAVRAGEPLRLGMSSLMLNGATYVPFEALEPLFGDAMNFEKAGKELRIKENPENLNDDEGLPDFKDDPNDPFGSANQRVSQAGDIPVTTIAAKNINLDAMLKTAKKYIGVKYDFGAKPYPKSGKFDCSTFTQYVYGKYGIKLPRLSRQQGKVGKAVSRTNLRKGDLLFFYLPGRYKSNKIIGHVAIYMGDGKMIHSSNQPKDGVQITSINKQFWKKTYLSARRVAY